MESQKKYLPQLRQDIKLMETSCAEDGSKQWLLFDPIRNKYYTIGQEAFQLISVWEEDTEIQDFLHKYRSKLDMEESDLETFITFMVQNNLTVPKEKNTFKKLYQDYKKTKQSPIKWLIHNYLFIRIPLFKPDKWLDKNMKYIDFLYTKSWQNIVFIIGLMGILLVLQDLNNFFSTFLYFFSYEGFFYYIVSLIFVKSIHELGHAFTAKRYGCKVASMGVAFLVLFPVLYTDTTDSWKLKSKYQRLQIVLAGMKTELYLAMISTFLWFFLPEGTIKSIAFVVATTSWITSLLVNISPFLRFDGYYALSDISDSKNLQPRSFAMARWFIRKNILGLEETIPEHLSKQKKNFFITYAILTWIYRFFLFLGIALLVYYFAFKVLGIILFLIEIIWFILMPIYKEILYWWNKKEALKWNKTNKISFGIFCVLILLLFIPWNTKVTIPAIIEAKSFVQIYSPKNAQIKEILFKNQDFVKQGDTLMILYSPSVELEISQVEKEIQLLHIHLDKLAGFKTMLEQRFILEEQLSRKTQELVGLKDIQSKLTVTAPFDGLVQLNDYFHVNQWIDDKTPLIDLYNPNSLELVGFCPQDRIDDIQLNDDVIFFANSGDIAAIKGNISDIEHLSIPYLPYPELSSDFQGSIATRTEQNKLLRTEQAYYKVTVKINIHNQETLNRRFHGNAVISAEASSLAKRFFNLIVTTLIKESGF